MNLRSPLVMALTFVVLAVLYFIVRRAGKKKLAAEAASLVIDQAPKSQEERQETLTPKC